MKYKKSIIVIILAVFLVSIAAASASDVNETVMASEDTGEIELAQDSEIDEMQSAQEDVSLVQTDNNGMLGSVNDLNVLSVSEGNYSDLRKEIGNGGNINLTKNYYRYTAGDGRGIEITKSGVIDGKGAVIDMAGGNIQVFEVRVSGVTIKNLTIKNVKNTYTEEGAIYFTKPGNVINCNFINNSAWCAGVVFESSGTVENCSFTDNKADYGAGAIWISKDGTVTNCNFTNNTAKYLGGAVVLGVGSRVTNCYFEGNKVTEEMSPGGAIYIGNACSIENCNFTNNTAPLGGALYFSQNSSCNVINCSFAYNKATGFLTGGGAIYFNMNSSGNVTNCNFTGNDAWYGGAIFFFSGGNVTNCNFTNNSAIDAGAIEFFGYGTVLNCNFIDNQASIYYGTGGAIEFSGNGAVVNCNFINNFASEGGAIEFYHNGTVTGCNFTSNNAAKGSAIYFWNSSATKTVSNSCFLNNRADAEELQVTINEDNITITFTGNDNLLNSIYSEGDVNFTNVTYWGAKGIANTDSSAPSRSNREAGQNITIFVAVNSEVVLYEVKVTDDNGTIVLYINAGDDYYINARHDADSYYTEAEKIVPTSTKFNVNVTSQKTNNKTVNITAKSNIFSEVMPGELLFILPNGTEINATYGGNGIWWALHTFDEYGIYEVNASYIGLDNVTINNATIAVKLKTELSANDITITYNINKDLIITLKDSTGKALVGVKVSVDLNGAKTYTTDGNGQVKISTKGLAPKTYAAKITFNGNNIYDKSVKEVKVTVKKANPKIKAKKKTFKSTAKPKKYTITLKDNTGKAIKNAKVTLKVKGKTYTAKTNSKGKATFKITKLNKKGTYKAKVTFKANKYYNKATKKVKIKVIISFKTVSKGSKDKSTVKKIQQALKDNGYYLTYEGHYLMVDGKYGSCTVRSVKEFQHDKGLKVTGKVDEKTAKKLGLI